MKLDLPDDILRRAEIGVVEMRLALAVQFYSEHRISHADACRLADVPAEILNRALAGHHLGVVHYPDIPSWRHRAAE
jgi:predicted HTH domain antitoxin